MAMISWVQSGLDLTIDLTVQDEDTKKQLKAGTAAAAVVASLAVGDAASLVQAGKGLGTNLMKEGLHAAGVEDAELDKAVELSASVGCGFAAPGTTAGGVLKQQAMELSAGAGAGVVASGLSDGEFSVLDSMTMTQGLGRGTVDAEGVQASQVGLRGLELAGAAGISAAAAYALGEDPVRASKLGAESGLQLMRLGRLELSAQAAEARVEGAEERLAEQEALAEDGRDAQLKDAEADLEAAEAAATELAQERDALRQQLGLQASASLTLALAGPEVGTLGSVEAGRAVGQASSNGLDALARMSAPSAAPPASAGSGYERLSDALAASGAVEIGSLAGAAGSVVVTVRRLRDQADARRLAELAAFSPELRIVAQVEWARVQELQVIEAGLYQLASETARLAAARTTERRQEEQEKAIKQEAERS